MKCINIFLKLYLKFYCNVFLVELFVIDTFTFEYEFYKKKEPNIFLNV